MITLSLTVDRTPRSRPRRGLLLLGSAPSLRGFCPWIDLGPWAQESQPLNIILLQSQDFREPPIELLVLARGRRTACLHGRAYEHVRGLLRASPGSKVRVGELHKKLGEAEVLQIDGGALWLACEFNESPPSPATTTLILAIPRPQTLKKVLLEATSLGVGEYWLVRAARTEKSFLQSHLLKDAAWREFIHLGLEQARDCIEPPLRVFSTVRSLFAELAETPKMTSLIASPGASELTATPGPLRLAIGPEGGWIPSELDGFVERGFTGFGLGPRILRVETATIAAPREAQHDESLMIARGT